MYVVGFMDQLNEMISERLMYWEEDECLYARAYSVYDKEDAVKHYLGAHFDDIKYDEYYMERFVYWQFMQDFSEYYYEDCFSTAKDVLSDSCFENFVKITEAIRDRYLDYIDGRNIMTLSDKEWDEYINNASKIFTYEEFITLFKNEEDMRQLYINTFSGEIFAIEVPDKVIKL